MNKPAFPVAADPEDYPDYESDGYGWAMAQGALLRQRCFDAIDWDNVAEEIESMGRSERSRYTSHLTQILIHMLKWEAQPERRGFSWWLSIVNNRSDAIDVLEENPSLKPLLGELHEKALVSARRKAAIETSIDASVFDAIAITPADAFEKRFPRPEGE